MRTTAQEDLPAIWLNRASARTTLAWPIFAARAVWTSPHARCTVRTSGRSLSGRTKDRWESTMNAWKRKLRMGMVGGGQGAFIGAVHRMAAALDQQIELVAGCFSRDSANTRETG